MLKNHLLAIAVLAASLAGALSACGPEDPPADPGFEADVKPIMLSRCVRCHGADGKLDGDPNDPTKYASPGPPPNGYFDRYDDPAGCMTVAGGPCRGAGFYAAQMLIYVRMKGAGRMPPPPAPELTDHQIKILERWAAQTPPKP